MSKISGRYIEVDGVTITFNPSGQLMQVPGTDGSGGGGGGSTIFELIPISGIFSQGYLDLSFVPSSVYSISLYIQNTTGHRSLVQVLNRDFSLVRHQVGGVYKRIVWDATKLPNSGNGQAIPDNDNAPTVGMIDVLVPSDSIAVYYSI